ncbi:uncharacterized protein LOC129586256 isoform X2 [Paramacrobiotus metropolitanus]|uniref:uncharacterized protein LOC129586256 isoform X2 n=1 Tax=Paramacrobiotus metropolitanus TaxID=2943436 RepID=UPI0024463D26|nr:uncharacterized protein LOC129586256 isoform X2 [Paramacrobiotus metropolitanus]
MAHVQTGSQQPKSLEEHIFWLAKMSADVYGIPLSNMYPKGARDVVVGLSGFSLGNIPASEPDRSEYVIGKGNELFAKIFECLLETGPGAQKVIKGECIQVLLRVLQFSNCRPFHVRISPSADRWRLVVTAMLFDCFGLLMELSPASSTRFVSEPVHLAVKLLDISGTFPDKEINPDVVAVILKCYRFLSSSLSEPLLADVFSPADIRELTQNIAKDVSKSPVSAIQSAAVSCSTILLQSQAIVLKTDTKNRLFTALISVIRVKLRSNQERRLLSGEIQFCWRVYGALTAFILSSAVHVGVLNVCTDVFEDGLKIKDFDVQIICKQGLQIISSLVRPRTPKEIIQNPGAQMEAAAAVSESIMDAKPVKPKRPATDLSNASDPTSNKYTDIGNGWQGDENATSGSAEAVEMPVEATSASPQPNAQSTVSSIVKQPEAGGLPMETSEDLPESTKERLLTLDAAQGKESVDNTGSGLPDPDKDAQELMMLFRDSDPDPV